jgi:hypothetical protein
VKGILYIIHQDWNIMSSIVVEAVVQCASHSGILEAIENCCEEVYINLKFTKYCMGMPPDEL